MTTDTECAIAAHHRIERLKMQLREAIRAVEELPGISEAYSGLADECRPYAETRFEGDILYAELFAARNAAEDRHDRERKVA